MEICLRGLRGLCHRGEVKGDGPLGITAKTTPEDREKHYAETNAIKEVLLEAGVRAETDMRYIGSLTPIQLLMRPPQR